MGYLDRIEIEFTSDVPFGTRDRIHKNILGSVDREYEHVYEMVNKNNQAHRIEITRHDRTKFDLTDGQVIERLRGVAAAQDMSVKELLNRLGE